MFHELGLPLALNKTTDNNKENYRVISYMEIDAQY